MVNPDVVGLGRTETGVDIYGEPSVADPRYVHAYVDSHGKPVYLGDLFDSGSGWIAFPDGWSHGQRSFLSPVEASVYLAEYRSKRYMAANPDEQEEPPVFPKDGRYLQGHHYTCQWCGEVYAGEDFVQVFNGRRMVYACPDCDLKWEKEARGEGRWNPASPDFQDGYSTGYALMRKYDMNPRRAWARAQQMAPGGADDWFSGVEAGINAAEDEVRSHRTSGWGW